MTSIANIADFSLQLHTDQVGQKTNMFCNNFFPNIFSEIVPQDLYKNHTSFRPQSANKEVYRGKIDI